MANGGAAAWTEVMGSVPTRDCCTNRNVAIVFVVKSNARASFVGQHRATKRHAPFSSVSTRGQSLVMEAATLEFIKGVEEPTVPDVKLTRSRDGTSGTATFIFDSPAVFEASSELGDITGLYMTDDEGTISTVEVQAKFLNGKPSSIEAKLVMRSAFEWDRFMRFMERYAEEKNLGFKSG